MPGQEQKGSCCSGGPGFSTPALAMKGPREKIVYLPAIPCDRSKPSYLATVDVDPESKSFCQILHRTTIGANNEDELHHSGWNACSSCHDDPSRSRNILVMPSINSSNVYMFDTATDPLAPTVKHVVSGKDIIEKANLSFMHSSHCLADGNIMISGMGDENGEGKGSFILVDGQSFEVKGVWQQDGKETAYGYDFWYQPRHNVMVSSEWGAPKCFMNGFNPADWKDGKYGSSLHMWNWKEKTYMKELKLGEKGQIPLECRFLHNPDACEGFVGCALSSTLFRFFKDENSEWQAECVEEIPALPVEGWALPNMPSLITDILISLDDKYLYLSNWLQGDIRQYDITDTKHPKLAGQVFLNGSCVTDGNVKVTDTTDFTPPDPVFVKGKRVWGGPQMLQLSLDGKRLYVSSSLFTAWDKQFYPQLFEHGSMMLQIDVDTKKGGLTLNKDFLIDFKDEPDGPSLAHEMRYPGGDCTSDIWV